MPQKPRVLISPETVAVTKIGAALRGQGISAFADAALRVAVEKSLTETFGAEAGTKISLEDLAGLVERARQRGDSATAAKLAEIGATAVYSAGAARLVGGAPSGLMTTKAVK